MVGTLAYVICSIRYGRLPRWNEIGYNKAIQMKEGIGFGISRNHGWVLPYFRMDHETIGN
ncbi:hypothetical protein YDYSG_13940 [Paenibacillus tyrfis]|nr:hypothetical protein YDYSG_13940 [Paenibacillus tyrfis]